MDAHIKSRIVSAEEARTFMGLSWVLTGAHPLTSNAPTVDDLAATVIALTDERDAAVMSAAIGEAVVAALHGEEVSDFMQSFGPVMEAQNIGCTVRLLEADRDALWRAVKDACGWLRVTDDADEDWPKLPVYAKQIVEERDRLRDILACERGERAPEGWTWAQRRSTDMVGRTLSTYHAWLYGPEDTGFEVVREANGGWSVALTRDRISPFPTALEAIEAADRAAKETK